MYERLNKLADYLDTIPEENYDQNTFLRTHQDYCKAEPICGTAACALGWATNIFPERLSFDNTGLLMFVDRWGAKQHVDGMLSSEDITTKGLAVFFEISPEEIDMLFGVETEIIITPKMKAQQIRDLIANK